VIETKPLIGRRPRGKGGAQDRAQRQESDRAMSAS
jgi:hypothetical protein